MGDLVRLQRLFVAAVTMIFFSRSHVSTEDFHFSLPNSWITSPISLTICQEEEDIRSVR